MKHHRPLSAPLLCVAALFAEASSADEFILAERGKAPECAIALAPDSGECVRYAAEELRRFVCETTGVELPIFEDTAYPAAMRAVVLGVETKPSSPRDGEAPSPQNADSFQLHLDDQRLVITGGGERGVLYGVYEVLERFAGCRWYSSRFSVVPHLDRIALPDGLDETQIPAFDMREPFWHEVRKSREFAARLRSNSRKWGDIDAKYGSDDWRFGRGLAIAHTFGELLPPRDYFAEHPEYYCMLDGARSTNGPPRGTGWQPCLTNPDVLRIVASNVLDRIRRDPGARFYGVSQQDHGNVCQCPDCRAVNDEEKSQGGTLFRFVNAVAEEVEKEFPDAVIETLAYMWSRKPPEKTRLRRNVIVCICTLGCDFALPISESKWKGCVDFRRDLAGWSSQNDRIFVWDYAVNYANYTIPYPNVYALAENIRFFRDNNVKYLFSQGDNRGSHADFAELKTWLTAKLMWDPDQPLQPLLDDFFAGYYGPAAPFVREWFEETHRAQRKHSASGGHPLGSYDGPEKSAIPDELLDRGIDLWQRAEDAVKDVPALSYNVRMSKFSFDCLRLWRLAARLGDGGGDPECADARDLARSIAARLEEDKCLVLSEGPRTDAELRERILCLAGE